MSKVVSDINELNRPLTVVVYRKGATGTKYYMLVTDIHVDIINNGAARKPIIPHKYPIERIGIGEAFIKRYAKQFNVKKYEIVAK
jgi:hypothetical protein